MSVRPFVRFAYILTDRAIPSECPTDLLAGGMFVRPSTYAQDHATDHLCEIAE